MKTVVVKNVNVHANITVTSNNKKYKCIYGDDASMKEICYALMSDNIAFKFDSGFLTIKGMKYVSVKNNTITIKVHTPDVCYFILRNSKLVFETDSLCEAFIVFEQDKIDILCKWPNTEILTLCKRSGCNITILKKF